MSSAFAEIVSEYSGFQHLHTSKSNSSLSTAPSRKFSTLFESMPRHSLNITIGAAPLTRNNSSSSLNSTISYLVVE
ncbi:Protein CBG16991 [Caenorhabditis briggsae]|nr:Protein CBG16991 [Caenorhabditis briggsae]CAP34802.1 Protein CBG16991 [Caenorhabditis briggsae]